MLTGGRLHVLQRIANLESTHCENRRISRCGETGGHDGAECAVGRMKGRAYRGREFVDGGNEWTAKVARHQRSIHVVIQHPTIRDTRIIGVLVEDLYVGITQVVSEYAAGSMCY